MMNSNPDSPKSQDNPSNQYRFYQQCLIMLALSHILLSLPAISDWLESITGVDILEGVGNSGDIGQGKIYAAYAVATLASVYFVAQWFFYRKQQGKGYRAFVLGILIISMYSIPFWYEKDDETTRVQPGHYDWDATEKLQIIQLDTPSDLVSSLYDRGNVPQAAKTSIDAYLQFAQGAFEKHKKDLSNRWKLNDTQLTRVIFYAGMVGSYFEYGNRNNPSLPGCSQSNEIFQASRACITEQEFLDSPIGCCQDYAFLLMKLLDKSGIPNQLIEHPGHIFNEVTLGSQSYIVDANTGIIADKSWKQITQRVSTIRIYSLPLAGMLSSYPAQYRPALGRMRLNLMVSIATAEDEGWQAHRNSSVPICEDASDLD